MKTVRLRCFPAADTAFVERADEVATQGSVHSAAALQMHLIDQYPDVVVHEKENLAMLGPEDETWYIYRDGHPA
jgi:hypothetical protein